MSEPLVTEPTTAGTPMPAPPAGMTRRVIGGSLWSAGGQGVTLLASLVATPFVIRLLGAEGYGVLALINVLIGYLAFTDMGMGVASTRFAAAASARGDEESRGEAAVVWTALLIAALPALVAAGALALCAPQLARVLRLPPYLQGPAIIAFRLTAVGFIARSLAGVLNTPQLVQLRMDLFTLITAGTTVAQICLVPIVLARGGNLVSAVAVIAGASVTAMLLHALVSWRLLPALARPSVNPALVRPLLKFGSAVIISSLVGMALSSAEKLMLTRFASVTALGHYSIAYTLANLLLLMPTALNQSLVPALSRLQAGQDPTLLQQLYLRALRGNLLWLAPAAMVMVMAARPFITFWAGPEYADAAVPPFYILIFGLVFNVMASAPYSLLTAIGKTNLIARYHLAELLPYLFGAAGLTYFFGATGAAIAWSLRVIADALLLFRAARQSTGFRLTTAHIQPYSYAVALLILLLPMWVLTLAESSLLIKGGAVMVCLLAYGSLIWRRGLSAEERAWMIASWHDYRHRKFGYKV